MDKQIEHHNKCRICLCQKKGLQPLVNLAFKEIPRKISYAELLLEVANINVMEAKDSKMPRHICLCCTRKLKSSHAFIKQARDVNEKLCSLLNPPSDHCHKLDCLEETEMDIQKRQEIKIYDGDVKVKNEPLSDQEDFQAIFNEKNSAEEDTETILAIKNDYEIIDDTDYDKYQDFMENSQNNIDSSESDTEDNREDLSSIDFDEISEESIDQDCVQSKPFFRKREQRSKEFFKGTEKLSEHLRNALVRGDKKCDCPICDAKFARTGNLYRHMRREHGPDSVKMLLPATKKKRRHECEKCHRKYKTKKSLNYHIKFKHGQETEQHKASLSESDMGSEKQSDDRHLCSICGSSFVYKSHLVAHMRRHTGEKPFKCDLCDKAFASAFALTYHRRIHTGEKPYECKICGKTFRVTAILTNHMRSHTDERPYQCTQCDRSFKYPYDLNIHIRSHTGERPYCCNVCGNTFTQSNALKLHRKNMGHLESST